MESRCLNRPSCSQQAWDAFPLQKDAGILRVLSYNIRIDHPDDRQNHHAWQRRKHAVVQLIQELCPDLLAIQEADAAQTEDLRSLLPDYRFEGYPVGFGAPGEERLLFGFLPSRLALCERAVFSLSPTPMVAVRAWDARYPRACVYGKFFDRTARQYFTVFNTHFDHIGHQARQESVSVIAKLQEHLGRDAVRLVLGDFNPFPNAQGDVLYARLLASTGLKDVRDGVPPMANYGPDGTWIGWEYDGLATESSRLDHLFVGGSLRVVRTGAVPSFITDGPRDYPSDHLPIVADLSIEPQLGI